MNEQVKPPAKPEGVRELPSEPVIRWLTREEVAASQAAWVGRATVHWHYDHDVDQAVALEREAIAKWHESRADELRFVAARYFRLGQREAGKITEAELHTHRISAIDIRNGEHTKDA